MTPPRAMTSIRRRTTALVVLGTIGLLAFGGAALFVIIRGAMTAQFDAALAAQADALRTLARTTGLAIELTPADDHDTAPMPQFSRRSRGAYFVAWERSSGAWEEVDRSDSLALAPWPPAALRDALPGTYDVELPGGDDGRAILIEFNSPDEDEPADEPDDEAESDRPSPTGTTIAPLAAPPAPQGSPAHAPLLRLAVAFSRERLDDSLTLIAWCITGVCAAFAAASVVASRWAVGHGLTPLTVLSNRIESLGPGTLELAIDPGSLPAELRPIAARLTALFARLDDAFEREQRFTAAASHELRTPIAELRMLLEVASTQPRPSEEWQRTADKALGVLTRAQALTETLLRLYRAGSPQQRAAAAAARTNVGAAIADQVSRSTLAHNVPSAGVRVECDPQFAARIDRPALDSIIGNLVDNALRHGQGAFGDAPGVLVKISARRLDGVHVEVMNPAPALEAIDREQLFEPFWQREASRHDRRASGGFGLGLALARALARSAGGDLTAEIDLAPGPGARPSLLMIVTLPAAPAETSPAPAQL
jgi:signal transduction histidine kinase